MKSNLTIITIEEGTLKYGMLLLNYEISQFLSNGVDFLDKFLASVVNVRYNDMWNNIYVGEE